MNAAALAGFAFGVGWALSAIRSKRAPDRLEWMVFAFTVSCAVLVAATDAKT